MNHTPTDRRRHRRTTHALRLAAPLVTALLAILAWEVVVQWQGISEYLLPAPSAVWEMLGERWPTLSQAWVVTLRTMMISLAAAILGGVALAVLFSVSPTVELSLYPFAVILQVTPLVTIAPLLMIWTDQVGLVLILCAWIVAFFPILANTTVGLRSADPGLRDLMDLYGASRWQRLRLLLAPAALPYFLAGLRTAVNLALIGTVVGEFVTGLGVEDPGLATSVFEGQYQSDTPFMFAALGLISLTGIVGYYVTHLLSRWMLAGWHESAA